MITKRTTALSTLINRPTPIKTVAATIAVRMASRRSHAHPFAAGGGRLASLADGAAGTTPPRVHTTERTTSVTGTTKMPILGFIVMLHKAQSVTTTVRSTRRPARG